ncbi:MAG: hypothetical protein H0V73_12650 [Chloroflexi bacterium]|nr:hypothetical protein [Chloroflexota bacterium]
MILGIVRRTMGEATDVQRVLFHRPEFLGRPLGAITHHAMRLPGDWSVAERELFAAFLSKQNRCDFCIACHGEYASQAGDRSLVERILSDGVAGDARLDAALEFLTAFATGPAAITSRHLDRLRQAGVRDEAIRDLAQIAFAFSLINRVADSLEFRVPGPDLFARSWPRMRDHGYRF